jgi:hypothetical protein
MLETIECMPDVHARMPDGHGAAQEDIYDEVSLPLRPLATLQAEDTWCDPFVFLEPEYALPTIEIEPQQCTHSRVTRTTHQFHERGPAPLEAHQCLGCGNAVPVEEIARRRV